MLKDYETYDDYVEHQKEKTLDPVRRKKWLGEEWELKLNGFTEIFQRCKDILKPGMKALCIGARTGQEVVSMIDLGIDAIGIDLVPNEPHVILGDMHNLDFDDASFDFVFTNVFDHSLHPDKMVSEIERVLIPGGFFLLQMQVQQEIDAYAENEIDSVDGDIIPLFKGSDVFVNTGMPRNFAGMNWEILVKKRKQEDAEK
jgi:SAM-dependent methyltransferase